MIPVIAGPTGSGKTAVATALAALEPIEVVSADSRQIYSGLAIGTAQPSSIELAAAPYHGLAMSDPGERYSAGRFARDASQWIGGIIGRGRLPVVVGGTGFYIRALFDGLFEEPLLDPVRRGQLRSFLGRQPVERIAEWAQRLDPGFTGGGKQRAQRSVEIALLTGNSLAALRVAAAPKPTGLVPWYAVLTLPREELGRRIEQRVRRMLAAGLVAEVQRALDSGMAADSPGLSGVGYPEVLAYLRGGIPEAELAAEIAASTRRYARRQETWFRNQLHGPVSRFDALQSPEALAREMLAGYRAASGPASHQLDHGFMTE